MSKVIVNGEAAEQRSAGDRTAASHESGGRENCRQRGACRAKTPGKHCPACSLSALHRDPAFRVKRAAAFRDRLASDPEFKRQHCAASAERLRDWRTSPEARAFVAKNSRANLKLANAPENLEKRRQAIRAKRLAGIPEDRWDEYAKLGRRMPAAEARRIILEDVAAAERRRLAALTPFERRLARVAAGAKVVAKPVIRRAEPDYTLGGVSGGLL